MNSASLASEEEAPQLLDAAAGGHVPLRVHPQQRLDVLVAASIYRPAVLDGLSRLLRFALVRLCRRPRRYDITG